VRFLVRRFTGCADGFLGDTCYPFESRCLYPSGILLLLTFHLGYRSIFVSNEITIARLPQAHVLT
jgi:hypothetical protein